MLFPAWPISASANSSFKSASRQASRKPLPERVKHPGPVLDADDAAAVASPPFRPVAGQLALDVWTQAREQEIAPLPFVPASLDVTQEAGFDQLRVQRQSPARGLGLELLAVLVAQVTDREVVDAISSQSTSWILSCPSSSSRQPVKVANSGSQAAASPPPPRGRWPSV